MHRLRQAAFIGRDCLVTYQLTSPRTVQWLPGALEAMRQLQRSGHELIMVIDQPGLATGQVRAEDHWAWAAAVRLQLHAMGIRLAGMLLCPHHAGGHIPPYNTNCTCHKPRPDLLLQAGKTLSLNLEASVIFAADEAEMQRGRGAGMAQLVRIDPASKLRWQAQGLVAPDLLGAVQALRRRPLNPA